MRQDCITDYPIPKAKKTWARQPGELALVPALACQAQE
jgi:hypothetical protein